jgi:hypothetical protein
VAERDFAVLAIAPINNFSAKPRPCPSARLSQAEVWCGGACEQVGLKGSFVGFFETTARLVIWLVTGKTASWL